MVSKSYRIRKTSDYQKIQSQGKRISANSWLSIGYLPTSINQFRWGCTLSRKVGNAVTRNRLKRWCREYFKQRGAAPISCDIIILFRPQKPGFYKELEQLYFFEILDRVFRRIAKDIAVGPDRAGS